MKSNKKAPAHSDVTTSQNIEESFILTIVSDKTTDKIRGHVVVKVWEGDEPAPMKFLIDGLVPQNFVTILSGHSGLGKSYVALYMAFCVVRGEPFLSLDTMKTNVLWIDYELNVDEMLRRSHQLARGIGLDRPPKDIYYVRPRWPLGHESTDKLVRAILKEYDIGLVFVDSLSIGSAGMDMSQQKDAVLLLKKIEKWRTTICIDHITKAEARSNQMSATIFGSTFKRAISRSTIRLTKAEGGGITLSLDKANFGPKQPSVYLDLSFQGDPLTVSVRPLSLSDPSMRGADSHMLAHEKTNLVLLQEWARTSQSVSLSRLADLRGISEKTTRNHITKIGDVVKKHGNDTYSPIPIPDSLDTGNKESQES